MDYQNYYLRQAGGSDLDFYRGRTVQRGYGLGGIFRRLFRWAVPLIQKHAVPVLKDAGKAVGSEVLRSTANLAGDVIAGKNVKDSFENRLEETVDNLKSRAEQHLDAKGSGYKRRRIPKILFRKSKKRRTELDLFKND